MDTGNKCLVIGFCFKEGHIRETLEINIRSEVSFGILTEIIENFSLNIFIVDVAKFLQEFTLKEI